LNRHADEPSATRPFRAVDGGVRLAVRLTPRASRDDVDGVFVDADGRPVLRVRGAAPPVDGSANAALIVYIASALGLRKSDISIVSGETARVKLITLSGDADHIIRRLTDWINFRNQKS
jgi:uncharacterized protein (TIGR00251 family)